MESFSIGAYALMYSSADIPLVLLSVHAFRSAAIDVQTGTRRAIQHIFKQ